MPEIDAELDLMSAGNRRQAVYEIELPLHRAPLVGNPQVRRAVQEQPQNTPGVGSRSDRPQRGRPAARADLPSQVRALLL